MEKIQSGCTNSRCQRLLKMNTTVCPNTILQCSKCSTVSNGPIFCINLIKEITDVIYSNSIKIHFTCLQFYSCQTSCQYQVRCFQYYVSSLTLINTTDTATRMQRAQSL